MTENLHTAMLCIPELRGIVSCYDAPTPILHGSLRSLVRRKHSLEIGLSSLSFECACHATRHTVVVPSMTVVEAVQEFATNHDLDLSNVELLPGDLFKAATALQSGSFGVAVVSAPQVFPDYFTAVHVAMQSLSENGLLVIRGAGIWTIDQMRNFLRIDRDWTNYTTLGEDAVTVKKRPQAVQARWDAQPYIALNSTLVTPSVIADSRSGSALAGIQHFSSSLNRLHAERCNLPIPRKQLGLVGYYGFGNFGDEMFRIAFESALTEFNVRILHDLPRRPYFLSSKREKIAQVDGVIIGGGDIVIPGYWSDLYFEEEYLAKPVFIHGVGIPRWTGGDSTVIKRLRTFFQHSSVKYINVRDQESKAWVEQHLKPRIAVDLSPDIVCGMDLESWTSGTHEGRPIFGLVTRKQPVDIDAYDKVQALLAAVRGRGYRIRLIIAGCGMVGNEDLVDFRLTNLHVDEILHAETMEEITRAMGECAVLASMKFHGCVVGLMLGIPTFGLLTTDKFVNLYRALERTEMVADYREDITHFSGIDVTPISAERISALQRGARRAMTALRSTILASV